MGSLTFPIDNQEDFRKLNYIHSPLSPHKDCSKEVSMGPLRSFPLGRFLFSGLLLFSLVFPILPAYAEVPYGGDGIASVAGMARDAFGNIYGVGTTNSTVFPQMDGFQTARGGRNDVFIEKLSPQLTLLKGTFFGGTDNELGAAIAIGPDGKIYIAGSSGSPNLPGPNACSTDWTTDVLIAKLEPDLMSVISSKCLGGGGTEQATAMVLDADGNVYIAGYTTSALFLGKACASDGVNGYNFFVAKFDSSFNLLGSACVHNGGSNRGVSAIARDGNGNVFVAGYTDSTTLPMTSGGFQPAHSGGTYDGFILKFDPALAHVQTTYFGGSARDFIWSLAVDASGKVYVGGETWYPTGQTIQGTANGAQPTYGGGGADGFVARFSNDLASVEQATFLGGSDDDIVYTVKLDPTSGDVFAAGSTCSSDFPATAGGYQSTLTPGTSRGGTCNYGQSNDGFVSRLSPDLRTFRQSTYYGGSGNERIRSMLLPGETTPQRVPSSSEGGRSPLEDSLPFIVRSGGTTTGSTTAGTNNAHEYSCSYPPCDIPLYLIMLADLMPTPQPKIELTPSTINFGTVIPGSGEQKVTVRISNKGTARLNFIQAVWWERPIDDFYIRYPQAASCGDLSGLDPGAFCDMDVVFNPGLQRLGEYSCLYLITSNDTSSDPQGRSLIQVEGAARFPGPKIQVIPGRMNFGMIPFEPPNGETVFQQVLVTNAGDANLSITSTFLDSNSFHFDTTLTGPGLAYCSVGNGELPSLHSCSLIIRFTTIHLGEAVAEALIRSNDPGQPEVAVPLRGFGFDNVKVDRKKLTVLGWQGGPVTLYTPKMADVAAPSQAAMNALAAAVARTTRTQPNSIQALSAKAPLADTPYTQDIQAEAAFMPPEPLFYVVVGATWKQIYPVNECTGVSNVTLSGNTLSYTITDNGDCDATIETNVIYHTIVLGTPSNSIILYEGWNFVSLPLAPTDTTITSVLEAVSSNVRIVWAYDSATRKWLEWAPGMQPGIGVISTMEAGRGYWIYASADCVLTITGAAPTPSVTLSQGWNLVGYTGTNGVTDADTLLSGIDGKWDLFWAWDEGWALKYSPLFPVPPYSPDFQSVVRGSAYWVRMKQGGSWGH